MQRGPTGGSLLATIVAVLAIHVALLAYAATTHSPTFDEAAYLPAGISHWKFGRFELYRACPHLVRLVAALPVLATEAAEDWTRFNPSPGGMPEFAVARDFIRANGERTFWYFTLARWACIPFSLLGALVCFRWGRELYGPLAGVLALFLWCFSPAILGQASLITADIATASLTILIFYLFRNWLTEPTWSRAIGQGFVLGLLLLTRSNAIFLFAFLPLTWAAVRLSQVKTFWDRPRLLQGTQLVFTLIVGLYVLNTGYLFDGSFRRLGDYEFASKALAGDEGTRNRFANTILAEVPVPFPQDYLLGIDTLKRNFEGNSKFAYLRGEFQRTGWWYYYIYGLAVKVPLGTWSLLLLAATLGWRYRAGTFEELMLLLPPLSYLAFVSAQMGLNAHVRYVLPIAPFLFIWIGKLAATIPERRILASLAVVTSLGWMMTSSLIAYPNNFSYFNELAGGAKYGHNHLLDSNIDWGQDLIRLGNWLDEHPEAKSISIAYFGSYSPADVGIPFELPPMEPPLAAHRNRPESELGPKPGWYAISVNFLRGYRFFLIDPSGERVWLSYPHLTYFQRFEPVARVGDSLYVYHLSLDDANRLRTALGYSAL